MIALPDTLDAGSLTLTRWNAEDVEDVLEAVESSIHELRQWMPWAQSLPTREEQQAVLSEGNAAFGAGTEFQFIYRETATNAVVGGGGLHRRVGPGAIEIGYWVRSDRHNRGYATTAARAMTDAAFVFLDDIDRVEIHMDAANSPSARVPEKLGYQLIRTETREKLTPANTDTTMVWQTTRSAWQELKELS